jgi:hypothetical protein
MGEISDEVHSNSWILARFQVTSPRSAPGSYCMKITKWQLIMTSSFKCGLPV